MPLGDTGASVTTESGADPVVTPGSEERAEQLKERIYVTFTSLVTVLILLSNGAEIDAGQAALTLIIVVLGTLLAVFLADFVSHLAVHGLMPTRKKLAQMVRASFGSFAAVALPLVLIGLSAFGVIGLATALVAATVVLLLTLVVVGYVAVRRVHIPIWQKLVVLLSEMLLGIVVVVLELLAHG